MKKAQKLKAGALQFVLFIGVVIAIQLLSFTTLSYTNTLFGKKTELLIDAIKKTDMALMQLGNSPSRFNDSLDLNLHLNDEIKLKTIKERWGVFEKHTVVAKVKKSRFVKTVLVGAKSERQRPALYLQDRQRPMIIVGKAKIVGDAYLPKQGIRSGNIAGNSYYGGSFVHGKLLESKEILPELDKNHRQYLENLSTGTFNASFEVIPFSEALILQNSFKQPTKIVRGNVMNLSGTSLIGNIMVIANNRIIVDAASNLKDVLLIAPEIIIKDRFKGVLQAVASKKMTIGKYCALEYPSSLVLFKKMAHANAASQSREANLEIGTGSVVKGIVSFLTPLSEQQVFHPNIKINSKAEVWGEVYCEGNLEHKGSIFGSAYTQSFIALESGSIYQNHFFNGTIDSSKLPEEYLGLPLPNFDQRKATAKWGY